MCENRHPTPARTLPLNPGPRAKVPLVSSYPWFSDSCGTAPLLDVGIVHHRSCLCIHSLRTIRHPAAVSVALQNPACLEFPTRSSVMCYVSSMPSLHVACRLPSAATFTAALTACRWCSSAFAPKLEQEVLDTPPEVGRLGYGYRPQVNIR